MLLLGTLPGTNRPAIGAMLPTAAEHPTLLIDVGANADCTPEHLEQFAHLGHIYVRDLEERPEPRIGLLNIGGEAGKGDQVSQRAYRLLEGSGLNFVGNVEGRDLISGDHDVVVCGGFVGNVVLKFYESMAARVARLVSGALAGTQAAIDLHGLQGVLDYADHGGAPLLGVNGVTIISHGDSPPRAIRNAVRVAVKAVESDMVDHLRVELLGLAGARA
jgi:glycerol-3-phosphate acyltransferase PlsX